MNQELLDKVESGQLRKEPLDFNVGDTVKVHIKVVEGEKERIQVFAGLVIGLRGHGMNETFTVRRISYGEGVERVFPVHSPRIDKVVVERQGKVRRAKLTYLRERIKEVLTGASATIVVRIYGPDLDGLARHLAPPLLNSSNKPEIMSKEERRANPLGV